MAKCQSCGKDAGKKCTRCKHVSYCGVDCQRKDWKQHKKVCFPEGAKCTRCLEIIDPNKACSIPHPVHCLEDAGSSFGGSCTWNYTCKACGGFISKQSASYDGEATAPIVRGPKFCYYGAHTTKALDESDERRIRDDSLVLYAGPDLQEQINGIPSTMPNVRLLTIQSQGCYDDSMKPKLEIAMPKLEKLKLIDVSFEKLTLNTDLTPLVEELFMQNIPSECELEVKLPELKSFSMYYYDPPDDDTWIHDMLSTAKKLQTFDSYKLRVGPELHFASNDLQSIRLHRAELLDSLSVYAPNLKDLNLQGCYGLDGDLTILDSHPNFTKPPGRGSNFHVNVTNACYSDSISRTLESHPRVMWDGPDDSDDDYVGNPCESMFARMHANGF